MNAHLETAVPLICYIVTLTKRNKWISMYVVVAGVVGKWQNLHLSFASSVATYVKCGGKHDRDIIANFSLNPREKEFWKSVNIRRSYAVYECRVVCFLTHSLVLYLIMW